MLSYRSLAARLHELQARADVVATYRALVGPLPERFTPLELMRGILKTVHFPTHDTLVYEIAREEGEETWDIPFWQFVCFQGLDAEMEFDDWDDPFKLVLCLFEAGRVEPGGVYPDDVQRWWEEQAARFDLPDLVELNYTDCRQRLATLPVPFDGLYAILRWCEGDSGWYFADIPCTYAHEMDLTDFTWSMETIRRLEDDWAGARRDIVDPAMDLVALCRRSPDAPGTCLKLAVGYQVEWLMQDGELILLEADYA